MTPKRASILMAVLVSLTLTAAATETYRLYHGVTVYIDNPEGRAFDLDLQLRDLNLYGNGPREVLFKVYGPDGRPLVREMIADDGVAVRNYLPRLGGWDHELQYYALCRAKGTTPMIRWSAASEPAALAQMAVRQFRRTIPGGKPGVYRVLLVGDRDHYATVALTPELPHGTCGHISWLHGHHDMWRDAYVYVPKGTTGLHFALAEPDRPLGRRFTLTDPSGEILYDDGATGGLCETQFKTPDGAYDDQILRLQVAPGDNDYLLRLTMMRARKAYGGFGSPAVLCPDAETAKRLRGGAIYDGDEVYWHPWQQRFEQWLASHEAPEALEAHLAELQRYFRVIGPSDGRDPATWINWAYAMGYYGFKIWRPAWLLSQDPKTPPDLLAIIREACLATGDRLSFALGIERVNGNAFAQINAHLWYAQAICADPLLRERYDVWFERWRNEGWGPGVGIGKSGDSQEHFGHDCGYGSYIVDNWQGKAGGGGTWVPDGILHDTDDSRFQEVLDRVMTWFSYVYSDGGVRAQPWNARVANPPVGVVQAHLKGKFAWKGEPGPDFTVSVNDGDEFFAARRPNYYVVTFHGRLAPRWLTETFWGPIGVGGGCIAQLTIPGKGTVLNSHPNGDYGKGMHESNWRNYHIHGVVGEMWDGLPFASAIGEHADAKLTGNVVSSSGDIRDRNLGVSRRYIFAADTIACEVALSGPSYQHLMTLWSKDRPYADVREAYEMIPVTSGGEVTLLAADGQELGAATETPTTAQTIVVDRGGYGVRIALATPHRVLLGANQTVLVELVPPGGAKPTPATEVALTYQLQPFR